MPERAAKNLEKAQKMMSKSEIEKLFPPLQSIKDYDKNYISDKTKGYYAYVDKTLAEMKEGHKYQDDKTGEAWAKLVAAAKVSGKNDLDYLKSVWNDFFPEFKMPVFKMEDGTIDMKAYEEWLKALEKQTEKGKDKVADAMDELIKSIIDKAKEFRDALGFFEKAIVEKMSPVKMFAMLKSQVKVFASWQATMASLKAKLGEDSPLYQDTLKQNVKGAGKARGLDLMSAAMLAETKYLYEGELGSRSLTMAGEAKLSELRKEQVLDRIVNVNINGGLFLGAKEDLIKIITNQLKVAGVY
jgi:hypothetical protein